MYGKGPEGDLNWKVESRIWQHDKTTWFTTLKLPEGDPAILKDPKVRRKAYTFKVTVEWIDDYFIGLS